MAATQRPNPNDNLDNNSGETPPPEQPSENQNEEQIKA